MLLVIGFIEFFHSILLWGKRKPTRLTILVLVPGIRFHVGDKNNSD